MDVALLCVPGFDQVKKYPESLVKRLNPRFVILMHWENFFRPLPEDPKDLRTVPVMDAAEFIRRLKEMLPADADYKMLYPGAWLHFEP